MTNLDRSPAAGGRKHTKSNRSRSRRSQSRSSSTSGDGDGTRDDTTTSHRRHRHRHGGRRSTGTFCPRFRAAMRSVLAYLLLAFHAAKDQLLEWFFAWFWSGHRHPCPPIAADAAGASFLQLSPIELAARIRRRELTATQLVEACVRRMDAVEPLLNAIVDGPFTVDALAEAQRIDESIAAGSADFERQPLLGVPFTCKDSTAAAGRLQTLGLLSRRHQRARTDAECVRLIKQAGGILLATTNVPEVNKWQETRNLLAGQTNNPYDTRRTVGGSSGGEAAAVAACMSPFGLGTDIGGSIRMPAFYCGIFGHKPTVGVVSTAGCTFRTGAEPATMVVAGPMARYAGDLQPLMRVLCGDDKLAAELGFIEPLPDREDIAKRLKFYYVRSSGEARCSPVAGELQTAMTRALAHLEVLTGRRAEEIRLPSTEHTSRMWRYWMTEEPADFNRLLGNGRPLNAFVELAKKLCGWGEFTLAGIYSLVDALLPGENEARVKEWTRRCDEELTRVLGDDGILLYHSTTGAAPFHYVPLINVYNFSYWALFNVLHVPVTQVPLGQSADGRPLGLQVVATRRRDRDCLAVAAELERAFGGWKAPF